MILPITSFENDVAQVNMLNAVDVVKISAVLVETVTDAKDKMKD